MPKETLCGNFMLALEKAKPKEKIAYHTGLLMFDRLYSAEVDRLAKEVWLSAGMYWDPEWGKYGAWRQNKKLAQCTLVQRRLSAPFGMEYLAVKNERAKSKSLAR